MNNNLALFSTLVADLPAGVIEDYYPQPTEIGSDLAMQNHNQYFCAIRAMLLDEQISADVDLRHSYAAHMPYIIEGSENDIVMARKLLAEIDLEDLLLEMFTAAEYGYRPIEIKYQQDGGLIVPVDFEPKRPESFVMLRDGRVAYRNTFNEVTPVPMGKVVPVFRKRSSEKPYGVSILEQLWPIWQNKWIGWANIERLGQKYAVPSVVALIDDAQNQNQLEAIANTLAPLANGDSAAVGGATDIKVLSASGKVDEILTTIKYIDNKITYRITGQTLSSGNQEYGSRSLGAIHLVNALMYAKADAKMAFKTLNQTLFKWMFEINGLSNRIRIKLDEEKYNKMEASLLESGGSVELSDVGQSGYLCLV